MCGSSFLEKKTMWVKWGIFLDINLLNSPPNFCLWLLCFTVKRGTKTTFWQTKSPLSIQSFWFSFFALRVCYFADIHLKKNIYFFKMRANQLIYLHQASIDHARVNARHFWGIQTGWLKMKLYLKGKLKKQQ